MYVITDYTKRQADKYGAVVKPSKNPLKKIDVIKDGKVIASVGAIGYKDYPTYIKEKGLKYANERRRLYRIRHVGENSKVGTNGWWAWHLLW